MKADTTPLYHISRNFVEFGAFTALEVASFRQRGILGDHDYVRSIDQNDWLPVGLWMAEKAPAILGSKPAKPRTSTARKATAAAPKAKAPRKAA